MLAAFLAAAATSFVSVSAATASISSFSSSPVEFLYPPPRGYSADTASVYPCGGIDPSTTRTSYPLTGGEIALNSQTLVANLNILYVNETDPTLFHDFSTYTDSILDMSEGDYCVSGPNMSAYTAGENATLLVIYQLYGNSTYYYHCADVTLVAASSYTAPTDVTCTNSSVILDVASDDNSLVLHGTNFTGDAAGGNGQNITITSTPTNTATSVSASIVHAASTSKAASAVSSKAASGSAAATSAAAAAASASSSGASPLLSTGILTIALGLVVAAAAF